MVPMVRLSTGWKIGDRNRMRRAIACANGIDEERQTRQIRVRAVCS
jgi:hypothetical protein